MQSTHSLIIICIDRVSNQNRFYPQIFRLPVLKYCKLSWIRSVETGFLPFATTELSPIEYRFI
jgi:hypothetical protein